MILHDIEGKVTKNGNLMKKVLERLGGGNFGNEEIFHSYLKLFHEMFTKDCGEKLQLLR